MSSFFNISTCTPYGINEFLFDNGGYCKSIIGNQTVNGTMVQLQDKEQKMRKFEKFINKQKQKVHILVWEKFGPRQSCLDQIDKIYCHHYFQRCYIDSTVQRVCREACEELKSKHCDQELKLISPTNSFDIIDCTDLPSWNESSICYHPNKIQGKLHTSLIKPNLRASSKKKTLRSVFRKQVKTTSDYQLCQSSFKPFTLFY